MKVKEKMIIPKLKIAKSIDACLVTKPSKKPAMIKIGTKPITIFKPSLAPFLNDCSLE